MGEGIETAAHWHRVRALGIDRVQGHYFAPPVNGEAMSALLAMGIRSGTVAPVAAGVTADAP